MRSSSLYLPKTSFLIRQNTLTFLTREGQILWSFAQKIAVLDFFFKCLKSTTIHKNATIYDSKMQQTSIQKHRTKFWHFHEFCNSTSIHIEKKFNIWKWKRSELFMSLEVVKKNRLMHELYKSFFSSCQRVWRQFFNKFSRFCIG